MKTARPTLIDILSPPANPWLQALLEAKAGDIPPWVHVVRFDDKDEDDFAPLMLPDIRAQAATHAPVRRRA